VTIPSNDCFAATYPTNTTSVFADDWVFPETDFGDFVPCTEAEGLVGVIKPVSVFSVARRFSGDFEASTWVYVLLCEPADPGKEEAIVSIRVKLRMACDPTTEQLYVEVQSSAYVGDFDDEAFRSSIEVNNYGFYRPPSTCMVPGKRICITDPVPWFRTSFLDTPLDVIVRLDETSLGPYTLGRPEGEERGDSPNPYRAMYDSVVENTEFTFRITSRPNCDSPIACNCDASLGGMRVLLGNLKSLSVNPEYYEVGSSLVDFVQMDPDQTVSWQGPFGFYEYTQLDPDGPQDGDGNYTRRLWYQRAELYCDVIDGVAQWFVLFTSFRDIYDEAGTSTHRSYDEWVGKIDCRKACEDLDNFIDKDEPVPMGEPYEIEYLGRTTETGYLECDPPPRLTIRLTQIVLC
jgi:hypothetical protein